MSSKRKRKSSAKLIAQINPHLYVGLRRYAYETCRSISKVAVIAIRAYLQENAPEYLKEYSLDQLVSTTSKNRDIIDTELIRVNFPELLKSNKTQKQTELEYFRGSIKNDLDFIDSE